MRSPRRSRFHCEKRRSAQRMQASPAAVRALSWYRSRFVRYQNTVIAAGAIVVFAARLLALPPRFMSPFEASLGRSLLGFNPFLHQPPPPSYPLYVWLGQLLNFFLHDALITLLTLSVIGSAATFVFLSLAFPHPIAIAGASALALIPVATRPMPDALAVAFFAAAIYVWRSGRSHVLFGICVAAMVGCVPQTIVFVPLAVLIERRWKAWLAFA